MHSFHDVVVMQVKSEIVGFLRMLGEVYAIFGLDYSLALSTRPEGYLGELELWDKAEAALKESLDDSGALRCTVLAIHLSETMFKSEVRTRY